MKASQMTEKRARGMIALVLTVHALLFTTTARADFNFTLLPTAQRGGNRANPRTPFQTDEFTGSFSYSIPIEVPPGRPACTPGIGLNYSSSAGNGWIGVGWSLDVGYIEREGKNGVPIRWNTTKTPAPNIETSAIDVATPLRYDDTKGFRFSFGGQSSRLVLTNAVTQEYRPERDQDGYRFYYLPTGWELYEKSGTRHLFGSTTESLNSVMTIPPGQTTATGNDKTFRWALSVTTDPNGNKIRYEYQDPLVNGNELYLKEIQYNGHTTQTYTHKVRFDLEDRKDSFQELRDVIVSYRPGYRVETSKRLKTITTTVYDPATAQDQRARQYVLTYDQSPSTGKSLLSQVKELGKDPAVTVPVHPPIVLTYQKQTFAFKDPIVWGDWQGKLLHQPPGQDCQSGFTAWNSLGYRRSGIEDASNHFARDMYELIDMDRDGLPDRVMADVNYFLPATPPTTYIVQHNSFSEGFYPAAGLDYQLRTYSFANDGTSDADGGVWGTLGYYINSYTNSPRDGTVWLKLIDIDGDGWLDRVHGWPRKFDTVVPNGQFEPETLNFFVEKGNGAGFSTTLTSFGPIRNSFSPVAAGDLQYAGSFYNFPELTFQDTNDASLPDSHVGTLLAMLTDINGDGLPDRVLRLGTDQATIRDRFLVQLNTSNQPGSTGLGELLWWRFENRYVANQFYWNNVATFDPGSITNPNTPVGLYDMNGDGLADRVMRENPCGASNPPKFVVQYNKGYGFTKGTPPTFMGPLESPGTGLSSCSYLTPKASEGDDLDAQGGDSTIATLRDINGDGLLDRVVVNVVPETRQGLPIMQVQINEGTHFASLVPYENLAVPAFGPCPQTVFSTENFTGPWQYIEASMPTPMCAEPTCFPYPRVSLGEGTAQIVEYMDINGDGLPDRVMASPDNENDGGFLVQLAEGEFPDLLEKVENGIGGTIEVEYEPSSKWINRDTDYNPMSQTPWQAGAKGMLSSVIQTVSKVTVEDGLAPAGTTTFEYFGGMYDFAEHEFRGFHRTTKTGPNGQQTITWFHQDGGMDHGSLGEFQDVSSHFKRGMPFRIETRGGEIHTLYGLVLNKVEEVQLSSAPGQRSRWFPFVSQTAQLAFEGLVTPKVSVEKIEYYPPNDAFANNLKKHTLVGEVSGFNQATHGFTTPTPLQSADDLVTELTYVDIVGNSNIKDHVNFQYLKNSAGTVLQQADSDYFTNTGNLLALKRWRDLPTPLWIQESFTYDAFGNVVDHTRPGDTTGNITTHTVWDPNYRAFPFQVTEDSTGTLNYLTTTVYDELSGKVETSTDWNLLTTRHIYDNFHRLQETWLDFPNQPSLWLESYIYTPGGAAGGVSGNVTEHRTNDASTSPGYHQTFTYADGVGRTIQERVESEVAGQFRVINKEYDENGNLVISTQEHFETGAGFQAFGGGPATLLTYDDIGRARWTLPPSDGPHVQSTYYNGFLPAFYSLNDPWGVIALDDIASTPSPAGREKREYHDGHGRVIKIEEVTATGIFTTNYKYDVAGNLTEITDHLGNKTFYTFDSLNRRLTSDDPDLGTWAYQYYDSGRLKSQTDSVGQPALPGQKTQYQYDHLGRPTTTTVYEADGVTVEETITFEYDSNNDGTSLTYPVFKGQLFKVTDNEGFQRNGYDIRGNLLTSLRKINANGKSYITGYTYDIANRVVTMSFPKNRGVIQYSYDLGGNLQKVEGVSGPAQQEVFYNANQFNGLGQLQSMTFGNGVTTTYTYYTNSKRLQNVRANLGATDYLNLSYTYDYASNVKSITDNTAHTGLASGTRSSLNYDRLHRLLSYSRPDASGIDFTYDAIGNMTSNEENGGTYTYPPSGPNSVLPHAVTSGTTYGYDAVGNMTSRPGQTLFYNARNLLEQVSVSGGPVMNYGYDASGNRLWKKQNGAVKTVWIGNYYEDRGIKEFCHVIVEGHRICSYEISKVVQQPLGGGSGLPIQLGGSGLLFRYYHSDPLNTANAQTERDGSLAQEYQYAAYGAQTYEMDPGASQLVNRFTDKILDVETGLYYSGARYYDPHLGRFIQADTITPNVYDPQQLNHYTYANNNPFKYIDPTGHWPEWVNYVGRVGAGAWGAAYDAGAGLVNTVVHPIDTLSGIGQALANFPETAEAVGQSVYSSAQEVLAGNPEAIGAAIFNVGSIFVGGAAVKAIGTAERVGQASLVIEEVAEAGAVAQRASRVARAVALEDTVAAARAARRAEVLAVNRAVGLAAEKLAAKQLVAEGNAILGSQVSVRTSQGLRRIDHLIQTPGGAIVAIEVKAGKAVRSALQLAKDSALATEGGVLVGKNVPAALRGQHLIINTVERIIP